MWLIAATVVVALFHRIDRTRSESNLFCAYGKVFVEFTDGRAVWGTMMLDDRGVPIPCGEEPTEFKSKGITL